MKLTKYEHACFTVEDAGKLLVVDPGGWTTDFTVTNNIAAIVITHEHADHFDPDILAKIYGKNPNSVLISLESIIKKMPDHATKAVKPGDKVTIGPFNLEFFGGKHALIHDTYPIIGNIGVMINDTVYYPGDSFTLPNKPVDVLAIPAAAPWLKISESIDFLNTIKPLLVFPTHDAILSEPGQQMIDRMLSQTAESSTVAYERINGKTIEV